MWWKGTGRPLGFPIRYRRERRFEFNAGEQLQTALALLVALLGSILEVNVEWDEANNRSKKKSEAKQS